MKFPVILWLITSLLGISHAGFVASINSAGPLDTQSAAMAPLVTGSDLVLASGTRNMVTVMTNNGGDFFTAAQVLSVPGVPASVVAAPLQQPGRLDLICANWADNTVSVLTNTTGVHPGTYYTTNYTIVTNGNFSYLGASAYWRFDITNSLVEYDSASNYDFNALITAPPSPLGISGRGLGGPGLTPTPVAGWVPVDTTPGNYAFNFWLKIDTANFAGYVLAVGDSPTLHASATFYPIISLDITATNIVIANGTETVNTSLLGIPNGWHQFAFSRDTNAATMSVYLDGVLTNRTTYVGAGDWGGSALFLRCNASSSGSWLNSHIVLDELGYWQRTLTAADVTNLFSYASNYTNISTTTNLSYSTNPVLTTNLPSPVVTTVSRHFYIYDHTVDIKHYGWPPGWNTNLSMGAGHSGVVVSTNLFYNCWGTNASMRFTNTVLSTNHILLKQQTNTEGYPFINVTNYLLPVTNQIVATNTITFTNITGPPPYGIVGTTTNVVTNYAYIYTTNTGVNFAGTFSNAVPIAHSTNTYGLPYGVAYTVPVGSRPFGVSSTDVNADGWPDIICANSKDNTITVLTNDGAGNLSLNGVYVTGIDPVFTLPCDVNNDGYPDILVVNELGNTLTCFINDGAGGFGSTSTYAVGADPVMAAAGTLSNTLYVAVANSGTNTVSLFFSPNGVLQYVEDCVVAMNPVSAAFVMYGTTNMQLVTVSWPDVVSVLTNTLSGSFALSTMITNHNGFLNAVLAPGTHSAIWLVGSGNLYTTNYVSGGITNYSPVMATNVIQAFTNNFVRP